MKILITVLFLFFFYHAYSATNIINTNINNTNINNTNLILSNSNNINISNQFVSEINISNANPNNNIIFDNYDEVVIQNFEKDNVTHIKFLGNVKIRFEGNILKARTVIITSSGNKILEIAAYEKVEFHYGDSIYLADYMNFNPETKKGTLKNVRSYIKQSGGSIGLLSASNGWYYHAKKVTILSDDRVVLEDVNLTFTPAELPQYQFFAQKLWYFKGDIIFALHDTYTVGQGDFFYMPFYFRWEKFTGIKTSFGQEIRIGWYLMNTAYFDFGNFNSSVGLDVYERLGQYSQLKLNSNNKIGLFKSISFFGEAANDVRVMYDSVNDRYSQQVLVNDTINGQPTNYYTNIQQLAWHYKVQTVIETNDINLAISWEDLNDPFFSRKYNTRRESFDPVKEAILNSDNNFYGAGRDDSGISFTTYSRSFLLQYKNFQLSGNWQYNYWVDPSVSNVYLNDRYKFYLYNVNFPNMSYTLGNIDIFKDVNYTFPVSKTLKASNTNISLRLNEDANAYLEKNHTIESNKLTNESDGTNQIFTNEGKSPQDDFKSNKIESNLNTSGNDISSQYINQTGGFNTSIQTGTSKLSSGSQDTNNQSVQQDKTNQPQQNIDQKDTNQKPAPSAAVYQITTNNFELYSFSSSLNANVNYTPSETLDTNLQSTPVSDLYHHVETGTYAINGRLFNSFINWNNTFTFNNNKYWSTFTNEDYNNLNQSGYELDFTSDASINKTYIINSNSIWQVDFPYTIDHTFNYQIFRTTYAATPLEYTHNTSLRTGFNMFKDNLDYSISGSHFIKYRITNDVDDIILNNITQRQLTANTALKITWLSASTGFTLDIMETKTNYFALTMDNFTNRLTPIGTIPLTLAFSPPNQFNPLPVITYNYDLIKQTNLTLDVNSQYSIVKTYGLVVYEISNLTFASSFHWDFLNPINSIFNLNVNLSMLFNPYWSLSFQTVVQNTRLYQYFKDNVARYQQPYIEFWGNLLDSVNILDYDALKRGNFKIQKYQFELDHYLNEWVMSLSFSLTRQEDPTAQILFWEPQITITFKTSELNGIGFPDYNKKFVPARYQ